MKNKKKLSSLKVESFVTTLADAKVKTAMGGNKYGTLTCEGTLSVTSGYTAETDLCD